jgi:hypothetical protein
MIKRNSFDSKYMNVHKINISSWSETYRTVFPWRSDIEQNKISAIPSRNNDDHDDDNKNNNDNNSDNNPVLYLFTCLLKTT